MITIIEKPKIKNIGGFETFINGIKICLTADEVSSFCLEHDMPEKIIFSINDENYENEYKKTFNFLESFCHNLKIAIPKIEVLRKYEKNN